MNGFYGKFNITIKTKTLRIIIALGISSALLICLLLFNYNDVGGMILSCVLAFILSYTAQNNIHNNAVKQKIAHAQIESAINKSKLPNKYALQILSNLVMGEEKLIKEFNASDPVIYAWFALSEQGLVDLKCIRIGDHIEVSLNQCYGKEIKQYLKKCGALNSCQIDTRQAKENNVNQKAWLRNRHRIMKKQMSVSESNAVSAKIETESKQNTILQINEIALAGVLIGGVIAIAVGSNCLKYILMPMMSLNLSGMVLTDWMRGIFGIILIIFGFQIIAKSMAKTVDRNYLLALAALIVAVTMGVFPTNESSRNAVVICCGDAIGANDMTKHYKLATILNTDGQIPDGATYTSADGVVYDVGDQIPDKFEDGDVYQYENYVYVYCAEFGIWQVRIINQE